MIVGVPREIKSDENRVALTPAGTAAFRSHGHQVLIESDAGVGSGLDDRAYRAAGAEIVRSAAAVWRRADLILKVKEPQRSEYSYLRPGLILFTYLHLAAEPALARELIRRRVTALGYETIQLEDKSLPLLAPMSEVAGRLAIQVGAWCLQAQNGGNGVLLEGILEANPRLRGIVFDLAPVVERARLRIATTAIGDRCTVHAGDFFREVPSGGDAYLLKHVIHDWDDEQALAILATCRKAMRPDAKLLVVEGVYPPRIDQSELSRGAAANDVNMLVSTGGQQRSADEFRALFAAAGFALSRIVPTPARVSVIEGVLRP